MKIDFSKIVYYDETSKSCLKWISKSSSRKKPDRDVGSLHWSGYYSFKYNYKRFQTHRVVWMLHNGEIHDNLFIDHIDGDRSNNKIENLRLVPRVINARNCAKGINNKTGINGVVKSYTRYRGDTYYSYVAIWM